jgi:hypothetical protein
VIAAKGDPNNIEWVLAMTNLQFGKFGKYRESETKTSFGSSKIMLVGQ